MELYTHHFEIRTNILHFMAAMDGAIVKRYNESSEVEKQIKVNYVYAPKSAILKDIVDQTGHIKFPIVAVAMTGFKRSPDRVKNKLDGYYKKQLIGDDTFTKVRSPVPIDISFELHAMAVYQKDLEQIITNWAAYFDPYIVVSWKEPYTNYEIKSKIIWGGDGNVSYPDAQTSKVPYRVELKATFTFEGWLFKADPEEVGKICCIDTEFHILSSQFCYMDSPIIWDADLEEFNISGIPRIDQYYPTSYKLQDSIPVSLLGNFINISSVFVSADNTEMFDMSAFDFFPDNVDYPYFNGYPIDYFVNNNLIGTNISPLTTGNVNFVVVNPCGYTTLFDDLSAYLNIFDVYPLTCEPCLSSE